MGHPTHYSGTGGALQRPQHARRLRLLHGHTGRPMSIYGHGERSCAIECPHGPNRRWKRNKKVARNHGFEGAWERIWL